jgi:hypothetical protein
MLSFKKGRAIAKVEGGRHDGKTLYVLNPESKIVTSKKYTKIRIPYEDPYDIVGSKFVDDVYQNPSLARKLRNSLKNYDSSDEDEIDEDIKEMFKKGKNIMKEKDSKELILHDGIIKPIIGVRKQSRQCIYVTGPSGSGKSTWIANIAEEYKKINPKNPVVLFSRLDNDESIDFIKPTRIEISEELLNDPVQPAELAETLTIFDDTDTIRDKKLLTEIDKLQDDLLQTGRHENVNVIIVSHLMSNYKKTRIILNECHAIVFFPKAGNSYAINMVLSKYFGCSKDQIKKMMELPSRWVALYKNYPMFVLYEKGAYLL